MIRSMMLGAAMLLAVAALVACAETLSAVP
jgi:hypothetical protein